MADHRPLDAATRVLCAGPDPYLTDLLRYALGREGYAVEVAASGAEASTIADRWGPHVAVIDDGLPWREGEDLAAWLRDRCGTAAVLLTAGAGEGVRAYVAPGAGYRLAKPFRLDALLGALEGLLRPATGR
jgi:DNA-binding response OmpR family regulator